MENTEELRSRACQAVDDVSDIVRAIAAKIHSTPEVAFAEHDSCNYLCTVLKSAGLSVTGNYCGLPTSFRADSWDGMSPSICFIAEYDALPGIGHGCGHNLIAAAAVGAALALKRVDEDGLCHVVLIGAPAEESGGGKAILVERGGFQGIDVAMMVHPATSSFIRMSTLAWQQLRMTFRGKSAHASGSPEKGANALSGLIETFNAVNALRLHVTADVKIHGIITHGGDAVNIIPNLARGEFVVRASTLARLRDAASRVRLCAEGAALATGTTVQVEQIGRIYEPMVPNAPFEAAFSRNLERLGLSPTINDTSGELGSSDVGNVSGIVPTLHPNYRICDPSVLPHSSEFAEAARSEQAILQTIGWTKAMVLTALDLILDPGLLQEVKGAQQLSSDAMLEHLS